MIPQLPKWKWVVGVSAIVLLADLISKSIVMRTLEVNMPYRGDVFFHFTHQQNRGLIGGAFSGVPLVPIIAPLFALALLIYMYRYLDPQSRIQQIAYGVALGGAFGNQIERVFRQSVTDFLQFNFYFIPFDFPWKYYPSFNVADCGIVVGVLILAFSWQKEPKTNAPDTV
ncbi:MAG: signal peptidase II [Candidatus Hydrogenedentota bacterium]|nr:MAG: signal peptidase II [Candidatus Hydrogenedentota bacterium]